MAHYLVTGGAGFIGSHVVDALLGRDEQVRVLDDFSTGKRGNLAHNADRIELVEGSLADLEAVRRAVAGVDYVLHLGAIPSVPRSVADPIASNEANVSGTLNLLVAARDEGVQRVVYSSSSSVYGNSPVLPKQEDMPTSPISPYAVSKLAGENYCVAFHRVYGLPAVCLRYFNVFGPRQDPASQYAAVIPKFITRMLDGKRPLVHGDGEQTRDFAYVANVVAANLLACERPQAVGQVMNAALGGGGSTSSPSLLDLVDMLNELLGTELAPEFDAARPGDIQHSQADGTRARSLLGFRAVVGFEEGLRRTVRWFREGR